MNSPPPEVVRPLIEPQIFVSMVAASIFAFLSLFFMGDGFTWKKAVSAIGAGLATAYFGTEAISRVLHVDAAFYGAIGAGCGFLGLTVLGIVMKILQIVSNDPIGTLQRLVPFFRKGGGQ